MEPNESPPGPYSGPPPEPTRGQQLKKLLAPVGFLDGGRIVAALSPWLWLVGFAILVLMTVAHPNFLLILILAMSLPRLSFLFRRKSEAELRYFEVEPGQRWTMAGMYFGLIALLVWGMETTCLPPETLSGQ